MFFQTFEKMSILVYYQTYQGYIAKYLCENRYVPESNCNGQCFLMKKLRKAEERKSTPVVPDTGKSEFIVQDFQKQTEMDQTQSHTRIPTEKSFNPEDYIFRIFHPPII